MARMAQFALLAVVVCGAWSALRPIEAGALEQQAQVPSLARAVGEQSQPQTAQAVSDVRDGRVAVIGENPGIRLVAKEGAPPSTSASFWRVFQSPAGAGHVCFVTSDITANGPSPDDVRVAFTDNEKLADYVASQLMTAFDKAYGEKPFPVRTARFERSGDTITAWKETLKADGYAIDLVWREFYEPFVIESKAGVPHNPYTILSTFVPAKTAEVVINGVRAAGAATPRMRGPRQSSSAFLAFAESWLKLP